MVEDFDTWYVDLHPPMRRALAAWCGDASVADEALDEAFVRACERWERVRRSPAPAGWVWRTATNLVRRHHRRSALESRVLRRSVPVDRAGGGPADADADLDLRAALLGLTERQRTVVVLHHIADLPHAEVAEALGIAVGTVAATLHQARARLARHLSGAGGPVPSRRADPAIPTTSPSPANDGAAP